MAVRSISRPCRCRVATVATLEHGHARGSRGGSPTPTGGDPGRLPGDWPLGAEEPHGDRTPLRRSAFHAATLPWLWGSHQLPADGQDRGRIRLGWAAADLANSAA